MLALRVAVWIATLAGSSFIAAEEPRTVQASIDLYRVSGVPITLIDERYAREQTNQELEAALELRGSIGVVEGARLHLLDFLQGAFAKQIPVPIEIDPGLVAPKDATPGSGSYFTDGWIGNVNLTDMSFRQMLKLALDALGLAFAVEPTRIRIATKETLADAPSAYVYTPLNQYKIVSEGGVRIGDGAVRLGVKSIPTDVDPFQQSERVTRLGRPTITFTSDTEASLAIEGMSPAEYLEPNQRPSRGSKEKEFVLRQQHEWMGLNVKVKAAAIRGDTAHTKIVLHTKYIGDREVLPGTTIRAGKPVYHRREIEATFDARLGHRIALLTRVADTSEDVFLMFITMHAPEEIHQPVTATASVSPRHYSIETTFYQMLGEPDWEWWMRPYERAYQIYEGAGRVIGPVTAFAFENESSKKIDWSKLGMRQVKQAEVLSSPRAIGLIDHKRLIQQGVVDVRGKSIMRDRSGGRGGVLRSDGTFASTFEHINELYEGLTGTPRTFTREELEGKLVIADFTQTFQKEADRIRPVNEGVAVFSEAISTSSKGVFSIQQSLLARERRLGAPEKQRQVEPEFFRVELKCEMIMNDGWTNAFLLPIAGDEYLVVLNKFSLVKD